jgi:hypothetical protein
MADNNQILTEIILDLDKLRKQGAEAEKIGVDAAKRSSTSMGDGIEKGFGRALSGLKSQLLGLGALIGGAFAFKKMISEASAAEDALNSFNSALRVAGNFSQAASERFQEYAQSLQRVTTASDDAIIQGGALLVSLGRLRGEGLEKATKAALDLSAGLNMDLNSAFDLMAKAATGNVAALSRYGIKVKDTGDAAQNFAQVLNKVNAAFGGLAESKVNTFSGALSQLSNNFGDVLENLGMMVVKSPVVVALVKFVSGEFAKLAEAVQKFGGSRDFVGSLIQSLLDLSQVIVTYVGAPLEVLYNAGKIVFYGLATTVQGFVFTTIAALRGLAEVGALVSDRFVGIRDSLAAAQTDASRIFDDFAQKTSESTEKLFNFDATVAAEEFVGRLQYVAENAKPIAEAAGNGMAAAFQEPIKGIHFSDVIKAMGDLKNKTQVTAAEIAKTLNTSMVNGFGQAFAAMGSAIAKGQNVWEAFGKSILTSLGNLLVTFGTMLIAVGVGLSTVPFLFGLQGPAAIAAGIAATILGGAMMALGGGGGGAGAASSGGGAPVGGGSGTDVAGNPLGAMNREFPDMEDRKPQTSVTVQVMGNVLDRRQTGLELVEVISEAMGSNGVQIVGA